MRPLVAIKRKMGAGATLQKVLQLCKTPSKMRQHLRCCGLFLSPLLSELGFGGLIAKRSGRCEAERTSESQVRGAPRGMNLPDPRRVSCYDDFWWLLITSFPSYLNHSESCRWQGSKGKLARQGLPGGPQRLIPLVPSTASHAGGRGGRRWRQLHLQGWMEWSWSHTEPNA